MKISRPQEKSRKSSLKYFEFKESIRNHSGEPKEKKPTITTQTKDKSSYSFDRSLTIPPQDESFMVRKSTRARKSSNRSMKVHSPKKRVQWIGEKEDIEHEREEKVEKVEGGPLLLHTRSQMRNLESGEGKGWGAVREQLGKRVAARQIKRILL